MLFWYFRTATFGPNVPSTTSIGSDVTAFDHAAGVRRASGFVLVGLRSRYASFQIRVPASWRSSLCMC
jgi:hypothetical protein